MTRIRPRESSRTVTGVKRRLAIGSVAACVAVFGAVAASGCGVQEGQEKIDKARQVQKQVESGQHKLEKKLEEGQ
jgi:hypothetical protein